MTQSLICKMVAPAIGALAATLAVGCGSVRAGYESAPYSVIHADGKFEVRDYPTTTVVETPMDRSRDGSDGSFNRLFRFISGGNEASQKIAMTTPVFMSGEETNGTMAFVMPAKMKTGDVPKPSDTNLKVRELPAGRFVVLRYSGARSLANEHRAVDQLRSWMTEHNFNSSSEAVFGYFDPPWTPAFLRRNEVMLRVKPAT